MVKKKRRIERKQRRESETATTEWPDIQVPRKSFADLAGIDKQLRDLVWLLQKIAFVGDSTQSQLAPRGLLLHGLSGCGKTLLAQAIAGEMKFNLLHIGSTEIISGISGDSESKVRDLFDKAVSHAPCVLLFDEIDAICQKREAASKNMESRIVSQLCLCMDELAAKMSMCFWLVRQIGKTELTPLCVGPAGLTERFNSPFRMKPPAKAYWSCCVGNGRWARMWTTSLWHASLRATWATISQSW